MARVSPTSLPGPQNHIGNLLGSSNYCQETSSCLAVAFLFPSLAEVNWALSNIPFGLWDKHQEELETRIVPELQQRAQMGKEWGVGTGHPIAVQLVLIQFAMCCVDVVALSNIVAVRWGVLVLAVWPGMWYSWSFALSSQGRPFGIASY